MKIIRNICLIDTPFSLMLYLLMMSFEEVQHTKFITGGSMAKSITDQLPNNCLNYPSYEIFSNYVELFKVRIDRFFKYRSILWAKVYAQDHLYISPQIIGRKRYTLIADAPNNFFLWSSGPNQPFEPVIGKSIKSRIRFMMAYGGTMYGKKYGTNPQCVERWLVGEREGETQYMMGKEYKIIDPKELWEKSADEKKNFIRRIFSFTDEMYRTASAAETLILSQPFREDCGLTDEEFIQIYSPYIKGKSNVVIKPHPRDKFEWEKYFPEAWILRTVVPMQLLCYMGIRPKVAISVSSTALSEMDESVRKVMLGTKVNEKIFQKCGDLYNEHAISKPK